MSLTFENHALSANNTRKSTNQLPEFHTEQKVGIAVLINLSRLLYLRNAVYCYHTGCYWQGLYLGNIPGDLCLHCGTLSYHHQVSKPQPHCLYSRIGAL